MSSLNLLGFTRLLNPGFLALMGTAFLMPLGATTIPIGYLSFSLHSPLPGQTSFALVNATGPVDGCNAFAPVCDSLILSGTLTIDYGAGGVVVVPLASGRGPGGFLPNEWILPEVRVPLSVSFTGSTTPGPAVLSGGGTFQASGLVTGASSDLVAEPDFLLHLHEAMLSIPEPSTLCLLGPPLVWLLRRRVS